MHGFGSQWPRRSRPSLEPLDRPEAHVAAVAPLQAAQATSAGMLLSSALLDMDSVSPVALNFVAQPPASSAPPLSGADVAGSSSAGSFSAGGSSGAGGSGSNSSGGATAASGAKRMRPDARDRGRMRSTRARRQAPCSAVETDEPRNSEFDLWTAPALEAALSGVRAEPVARSADIESGDSDCDAVEISLRAEPASPSSEVSVLRRSRPAAHFDVLPDALVQRIFACVGPLACGPLGCVSRRFASLLRGVEWDRLVLEASALQGGSLTAMKRAAERVASGRLSGVKRLIVRIDGRCPSVAGPGGRLERPVGARQAAAQAAAQAVDLLAACVRQPLESVYLELFDYPTEEEQRAARAAEVLPLEELLLRAALALAPCAPLRGLALSHLSSAVANAALPPARWRKALSLLPALESLQLPRTLQLTPAHAAAAAASLPRLQTLDVHLSQAPAAGETLAALAALPDLRDLRLAAGPRDGAAALGRASPPSPPAPPAPPSAGGQAASALGRPTALRDLSLALCVPASGDGAAEPLAALAGAVAAAPALRALDLTIMGATEYDRAALNWEAAAALAGAARGCLRRWSASVRGVPSPAALAALAACSSLQEARLRMRVEDELDIAPLAALGALLAPGRRPPARLVLHVDAPPATARPAVHILRRWLPAAAVNGPPGSNI
eukprot:tig00000806_g4333.t1